jgi:hypothetical protein
VRSCHRGPGVAQGRRVALLGADAQEVGERLELALSRPSEDLAEQAVAGPEVVDQHPARGSSGGRQWPEPVGKPVLERVVGAHVEQPLPDVRLRVPSHALMFSRNDWFVYCRSTGDPNRTRRS